jgi:hypothetical protein
MTTLDANAATPVLETRGLATRLTPPLCLLGAAIAVSCFFVLGIGERGGTGAEVTTHLEANAARYQLASLLAIYAALPLCVAAVRLGRRVGGDAGRVASAAGTAVALLMAAYYSAYAAGVSVASLVLDEAGPGVGEATLVLLNGIELARYAPTLLLVTAVLVARRRLSRALTVPAWVLLVLTVFPVTTWIAALLVPVWLGVAGAVSARRP